ncbi:P-loop containing nucleoside triphosphate hydrolase protein [Dioszegia hungarica]|uniref:P-loop containing nucleoside triphosphate hydrolase protein n=1 Tax=Dioszegia hungarica TaxID=4972 RepID=A0AA38HFP8_9TREE|nr:P-loop containing nucleoside triphosphate hydrolase protein [Dioszegia hungarica]KAI9638064.1 P-loop containing nucleoside triphosphate hydrolase protein [Dioszegia hungarica]
MLELLGPLAAMDQSTLLKSASQLLNTLAPGTNFDLPVAPGGDAGLANSASTFIGFAIRAILFGYVLNWARRIYAAVLYKANKLLFPTAHILQSDSAYSWVQSWMAADPNVQNQLDDFMLSTRESSKARGGDRNLLRSGRYDDDDDEFLEQVIRIRYKGCWIWVSNEPGGNPYRVHGGTMKITTLGYQKHALRSFLAAAHAAFYAKEERELLIFHSESGAGYTEWQDPISRPSRPWSSVILPLKEPILKDMERFLSNKESRWYAARGIPHRRGYLFHGEPGAGKTTLVTALASRLRLDIYVISICQNGMDDNKLSELFRNCQPHSIILLEDIDRIFSANQSISTGSSSTIGPKTASGDGSSTPFILTPPQNGEVEAAISGGPEGQEQTEEKKEPSVVTMSGLLNAIDGVSSQEGCILIASTNHPEKLDPALTRAGRFDVRVPFHSASPEQARLLFLHFFPAEDFRQDHKTDDPLSSEVKLADSGVSLTDTLDQAELDSLARAFSEAVFPNGGAGGVEGTRVAMASMQAYLLNFKESPRMAVSQAAEWARSAEKGGLLLDSPTMIDFA